MHRRALLLVLVSLTATSALIACGEEEVTDPVDNTPIVGLYEVPISRNNQATSPSNAARLDISPTLMRLDGIEVVPLERGRPAEGEVSDHVITKLRERITSGAARERVALRIHASVPYVTFVEVLNTLHSANARRVLIAVRTPGDTPREGWMQLPRFTVVAHDAEVEFATSSPPWRTFTEQWRAVYDACRAGRYIDCDGPYARIAEGGELGMELWTRGQGMKVSFSQTNAPEVEPTGGGGGVAMIEGVAAAPPPVDEDEGLSPPATMGAFTVRHQESTQADSALSNFVQPVCGNTACTATVETDATTPCMRVISMVGAVFANGFTEPELAFRLPEER